MIGIYKITSPSGRIYIGQSVDINRRLSRYKNLSKQVSSSIKLYRSLLKHGPENHIFEIVELCEKPFLNEKERYWQEFYNATSPENLNCILTETTLKRRIVGAMSDEHKAKVSAVHKGKKLSEETIRKIKVARSKQIITLDHKKKISENSGSARVVLDLSTGVFFNSAKEAAHAYGLKSNTLVCRLIGKVKNNSNLIYA